MKEITYTLPREGEKIPLPLRGVTLTGGRVTTVNGQRAVEFNRVQGRPVILLVDETSKPGLEAAIAEAKGTVEVDSAKVDQLKKELADLKSLMNYMGDSELTDSFGRPTGEYRDLLRQEKVLEKAIRAAGGEV